MLACPRGSLPAGINSLYKKEEEAMPEITLADLMQTKETAVPSPDSSEKITSYLIDFTPEERQEIDTLKEEIDIRDSQMLMQYGSGARQNVADFSAHILNDIRAKDSGYIGDLISKLVSDVQELDFTSLQKESGILGLFQNAEKRLKRFLAQFEKLEVQVERIEGKLDEARMEMLKDIGMFDTLYEKNLACFKKLQIYITAGEEKVRDLRDKTIPSIRAEADRNGDPMSAQLVRDFEDTVDQFEKKIYDLKTSRTIALQTAPQIRLIQSNDKLLADRIQTAIQETIPLWKSQMLMLLGQYRQQKALKLHQDITKATNEMLIRNSEILRQNTTETARESEKGIVDIQTLQKTNENLIAAMNEAVKIQQEGREKRAAAERELERIDTELKQAMLY